ncbi:MAG: citramalate synthase, partial [Planctomycetota bacterium]
VRARTSAVAIVGKSWDFHVFQALRTTLDENLRMIADSVRFLRAKGREVVYDAEHFFDGHKANPGYAMKTLEAALDAGASFLALCDTNGGTLPHEAGAVISAVRKAFTGAHLGFHGHNDAGCAVANSLEAVRAGAVLVQGTVNGIGERCGNADLCAIAANLSLKMGRPILSQGKLRELTELSLFVYEIANLSPRNDQPYVGASAFAHKGGIHVSAVHRSASTYEHVSPESVGNERRILVSELSGRATILGKMKDLGLLERKKPAAAKRILSEIQALEKEGYLFESAEASFELIVRRALGKRPVLFEPISFRTIVDKCRTGPLVTEATVQVRIGDGLRHTCAEGDGPINALDSALRKALAPSFPSIREVRLVDYKVRVINSGKGTAAKVRVTIESQDSRHVWGTVGVSENVIEASWKALLDSFEYKILRDRDGR